MAKQQLTSLALGTTLFFGLLFRALALGPPPSPVPSQPPSQAQAQASPSPQTPVTAVPAVVPAAPLDGFRKLYSEGKIAEAFKSIEKAYVDEKDQQVKSKLAFGAGVLAYQQNNLGKAADYFHETLQLKSRLDDYAQYYLGLIEKENKDFNGARQHFEAVRSHVPASVHEADAEIELVNIARDHEKWGEAYQLLIHLERKHRHEAQYQEILYNLIEASFVSHHNFDGCRAAVKLYSTYPTFTLGKGWSFDIEQSKVAGIHLRCSVSVKEKEKRIQQLLIAGEFDEIPEELKDWAKLTRVDSKPHPDEMGKIEQLYGQLYLTEGKINEAIAHLLTSQDLMGRNFTTQMLLAKAYSQTDDYPSAVEGYMKAYELSPHSKLGQKALFQAAFLSYQNQDYDGASRRFEQVVKKARGGIVLDARWHLAWIRYLKADYDGAKREFAELSKNKHFSKSADMEKLQYWRGMAEYRDGNIEAARALFIDLSQRKRMGYYTGAAQARLAEMPSVKTSLPLIISPSPEGSPTPLARKPASSDEGLGGEKESSERDEGVEEEESFGTLSEGPNELPAGPSITSLKNSSLVARFERAQDLIDLGFNSWAILELREIEKRTTNRGYLQALMDEYLKAGDFYRSAYIAEVIFEGQREKAGIDGATMLWSFAFPQAYAKSVLAACKKFDVPPSLVWSVMRGESGFREDIHSGAGAIGLMQLIPPTAKNIARELNMSDFKNYMLMTPETNITLGAKYLKRLNKVMQNNLPLSVASYNAGPHRVKGWLKDFGDLDMDEFVEHIPYLETRNYVKKVLRNYFVYQSLYEKKQNPLKWLAQKVNIKFSGPKPTAESWDD